MSGAGPTGVGAAKIVAEYIRLRSTLDEDDAANIIHILHEAGVRFRLPSSNAAEGAGETDALAREDHWRKLEGRDPSPLKPAPDAMREACAKIADSYTAPNRFKVSDQWKDDMSPAQVYETAAIDVSIAISKEIRDISAPVPPPDGASKEKPAYLKCPKCGEVWCLKHGALAPSDDVRSALADALESAAQCVASSHAMPGAYAKGVLGKIEKAQAALRSAPVSGPDLNRAALAEIIHKARFSADRVATSFADEHGLGREYCFRIADSVLAFIGSSAPVTREAMILAGAKALFKRDVEEDVIDGEWDDNAAVHERIIADSAACLEAALALHSPVPEATVSGKAWPQSIETWNLEKHGRHIIGKGHDFGAAEYCFFDDGGWTVATFNGQIIRRTPEIWWPMIPPSRPQHVGREATVSGPAAWQALPYATPQELIAAFKGGGKFVLHYHGKTFDVTRMEARDRVVYIQPPGLPVKVLPDGSSAEGDSGGIWLAATVSARDAVIEAATEWFNGLEPDFLLNQKTRHAAFDELIRSLTGAKPG